MNRARVYVLATVGIVALASLSLWLVPRAVRQAAHTPRAEAVSLNMTFRQAAVQVDSALQTYRAGMEKGDIELALSGCDTNDAAWVEQQRQIVQEVHARLAGHPGRLLHSGGYWITHFGAPDSVATAIFGGALVVQDTLTGQVAHEEAYQALARYGRFRLVHPPTDEKAQLEYRQNLGGLYHKEAKMPDKALAIWRQLLAELPQAKSRQRQGVYQDIAELLEEQGDFTGAAAAYEQALGLTEETSFTSIELDGKQVTIRQRDGLKYRLAQCALAAGQKDKARALGEELAKSQTEELAAAARRILAGL